MTANLYNFAARMKRKNIGGKKSTGLHSEPKMQNKQ